MKTVFKTAAMSVIYSPKPGPLKEYYEKLLVEKHLAAHQARHAVARRIAVMALGILKSKKPYQANKEIINK